MLRGLALVLLLPLAGCTCARDADAPAPEADGAPAEGAEAAPEQTGVKVPLAPGWVARLGKDGSLQTGPPGRPVLRVDIRPGAGASMPTAEALAAALPAQFPGFRVRTLEARAEGDAARGHVRVRVGLAPLGADGGAVGAETPAFFGARRLGDDLFLCASEPGAQEEEVARAADACATIEVPGVR